MRTYLECVWFVGFDTMNVNESDTVWLVIFMNISMRFEFPSN